jgi:hypothetical protein
MLKLIAILAAIFLLSFMGFYAFNRYTYNQKQGYGSEIKPHPGTLTGEYVCLPHRNTGGPQTLECAFGIKTDVGEYYALDLGQNVQAMPDLQINDRFKVTGTITPIELLSTDHWQKYNIVGILSADSVEKL